MRDWLIVRALDPTVRQLEWTSAAAAKSGKFRRGNITELARAAANRRVALLIPATDVLLIEAKVPSRTRTHLLKAVPFALEEYLVDDTEALHFSVGKSRSASEHPVVVIHKQRLKAWLAPFEAAQIKIHLVTPESLAIPRRKGWTLIQAPDGFHLRIHQYQTRFFDTANLPELLKSEFLSAANHKPEEVHWLGADNLKPSDAIKTWFTQFKVELKFEELKQPLITLFAEHFDEQQSINLLQGETFSPRKTAANLRPWYSVAAALLVFVIVQGVYAGARYFDLRQEHERLYQETTRLFKQAFPDERKFTKMRERVARQLSELKKQQGSNRLHFIELLGATGGVFKGISNIELAQIHFRNGVLDVHFTIDSSSKIDLLEQQLKKGGLQVDRGASTNSPKGYVSHMKISGGRP